MSLNDFVQEWLDKAGMDLSSAKYLLGMKPLPTEIIGFHLQQAIEKTMKGYLVLKDISPSKTHDLVFLKKQASEQDSFFNQVDDNLLFDLNPFAVEHRYPSESTETESDIIHLVEITENVKTILNNFIAEEIKKNIK